MKLTSNKPICDLSWGDPAIIRQALTEILGTKYFVPTTILSNLGYTDFLGTFKLINQLKELTLRQSGWKPKHLVVTCGASGAVNAALYALRTPRTNWVVTNRRYFPVYQSMIDMADMIMVDRNRKAELTNAFNGCSEANFISLIDNPSNPEGLICPFESVDIFDAAYQSRIYNLGCHTPLNWKILCGSLSKTLGLPGLRLGWACTDDSSAADSLAKYVSTSYVGLSGPSMMIAEDVLETVDLDSFENRAANYLDQNREEIQKILTKFGQGDVPSRGMFAILELGKAERRALEKAGIVWMPGSKWGEHDGWARLSLGQNRTLTRAAVKGVLR